MNDKLVLMNSVCWEITQYNNIPQKDRVNIDIRRAARTLNEMTNFYVDIKKFFKYNIKFNETIKADILISWCEKNCKGPWRFEDSNLMSFCVSDDAMRFKLTYGGN